MSQPNLNAVVAAPTQPAPPDVRGAIARAATATGVDFSYLMAQARLESGLDPQARAATSSAAGLYQFTKGTWSSMLARHGAALGLDGAAPPSSLMAMRYDPGASAMMAAELTGDNSQALTGTLGRTPTSGELYLAHFLGLSGATSFLAALATDPTRSAAALLPKAAAANPAVFYEAGGASRSLGAVMALLQTRLDTAMAGSGDPAAASYSPAPAPPVTISGQFAAAQADAGASGTPAASSMADTLASTFALSGDGVATAPDFVRSAYGRMQALGL